MLEVIRFWQIRSMKIAILCGKSQGIWNWLGGNPDHWLLIYSLYIVKHN